MFAVPEGPSEAKIPISVRRIHLIRRPYAKRRGRRETMFDCPLSKTVKILDQRSCRILVSQSVYPVIEGGASLSYTLSILKSTHGTPTHYFPHERHRCCKQQQQRGAVFFSPASRVPPKKRPPDSNSAGPAYPKTAAFLGGGSAGVWVPKIY